AEQSRAMALRQDGTVWSFSPSREYTGPLAYSAEQVPGLGNVTSLAAAGRLLVVLRQDGTVWTWDSSGGQRGPAPVQVPGLEQVTAVAGGRGHILALKRDGTLWGWGSNAKGQLGAGTPNHSQTPVRVPGLGD
ncbi:MAG TPA: RCC1 repeat-containing protein, partial [Archangium sp.]|nr:RCC1 repeat-containing protein [Archangium sp.]